MLNHFKRNFSLYLFFSLIILIVLSILTKGWLVTWSYPRLPALLPPHFDLRFYYYPALAIEAGRDPLFSTHESWAPANWPGHSRYYLPMFKLSHFLNFHKEIYFIIFANFIIINLIICIYKLIKLKKNSFWILILFFSGSTLLGIERTNNDLIIFCLLYWVAVFPNILGTIFVLIATYIEFWPLASAISFIKKKIKILLLFCLVIFVLYFYKIIFSESGLVVTNDWFSFGSKSTSITFQRYSLININHTLISFFLILLSLLTFIKKINFLKLEFKKEPNDFYERLFLIGSSTFCGLYILQSNYDYKLILLILCVPYITLLKNKFDKYLLLICMIISSNYNLFVNYPFTGRGINIIIPVLSKNILFVMIFALLLKYIINYWKINGFKKIIM
jgi:hypothetical protein